MLKKATMTSSNTPEHDSRARLLIDIFMFSTLFNLTVCEGRHFQSYETNLLMDPETGNRTEGFTPRKNEPSFVDEHPSPATVGLSQMAHWIFDKDGDDVGGGCKPEKGGDRNCGGRSLRWVGASPRFAGHRKRLQFALLPIMYKMGVMTTLLTGLTILALKGLAIGVILLIFAFGHYFTKLHKQGHGHHNAQPIHVHVHSPHGDHGKITGYPIYESGIEPWDRTTKEATPTSFLDEDDYESYRRRLIQNSAAAASLKFKPLLWPST